MLSHTVEYALRAVVYLYGQEGSPRTVAQIAEATQVPASYLAKIMQGLNRAKLVKSQRGIGGGFQVASSPEAVTVLEVVSAVDPIRRFPHCPLGVRSHGRTLCPLHRCLDDTAQMVEDAFRATTMAELMEVPSGGPNCRFPIGSGKSKKK